MQKSELTPGKEAYLHSDGSLTTYIYLCPHIDSGYYVFINKHNREPARMSESEVSMMDTSYKAGSQKLIDSLEYRVRKLKERQLEKNRPALQPVFLFCILGVPAKCSIILLRDFCILGTL